jgi:hypothetical protein
MRLVALQGIRSRVSLTWAREACPLSLADWIKPITGANLIGVL